MLCFYGSLYPVELNQQDPQSWAKAKLSEMGITSLRSWDNNYTERVCRESEYHCTNHDSDSPFKTTYLEINDTIWGIDKIESKKIDSKNFSIPVHSSLNDKPEVNSFVTLDYFSLKTDGSVYFEIIRADTDNMTLFDILEIFVTNRYLCNRLKALHK